MDPLCDRTQFLLRGMPRQLLWASLQWEDGISGVPLEPKLGSGLVGSDAATRKQSLVIGSAAGVQDLCILGVPMQPRRQPLERSPVCNPSLSVPPRFKLEAKVAVDDGTGEVVVQLYDSYTLEELEQCANSLESLAAKISLPQGPSRECPDFECEKHVAILRIGVAATALKISAFWLAHWAAAAAFFGPLQVLPRLAGTVATSIAEAATSAGENSLQNGHTAAAFKDSSTHGFRRFQDLTHRLSPLFQKAGSLIWNISMPSAVRARHLNIAH